MFASTSTSARQRTTTVNTSAPTPLVHTNASAQLATRSATMPASIETSVMSNSTFVVLAVFVLMTLARSTVFASAATDLTTAAMSVSISTNVNHDMAAQLAVSTLQVASDVRNNVLPDTCTSEDDALTSTSAAPLRAVQVKFATTSADHSSAIVKLGTRMQDKAVQTLMNARSTVALAQTAATMKMATIPVLAAQIRTRQEMATVFQPRVASLNQAIIGAGMQANPRRAAAEALESSAANDGATADLARVDATLSVTDEIQIETSLPLLTVGTLKLQLSKEYQLRSTSRRLITSTSQLAS